MRRRRLKRGATALRVILVRATAAPASAARFLAIKRQQRFLRLGEFAEALVHERLFQVLDVDLGAISATTSAGGIWSIVRRNVRPLSSTASLVAAGWFECRCRPGPRHTSTADRCGFFVPVLANTISCLSGVGCFCPELLVGPPDLLHVDDADLPLRGGRQLGHVLLGVHVDARDEDAVDALEPVERLPPLGAAPDRVAGRFVLPHGEDERHVERHARGRQLLQRAEARRRGGDLDHAVVVACGPALAQLDVRAHALGVRQLAVDVFQQRVELEAHVAVVAARLLPRRAKDLLGRPARLWSVSAQRRRDR